MILEGNKKKKLEKITERVFLKIKETLFQAFILKGFEKKHTPSHMHIVVWVIKRRF